MCAISSVTNAEARQWEMSENLHRSDLTVQERSEQIAEWAILVEKKRVREAELQLAQLAPIESKRKDGRGHRREGGDRKAARDLGLTRDAISRAQKIAAISPEAKQAAERGWD